jgi:hypothetical protein
MAAALGVATLDLKKPPSALQAGLLRLVTQQAYTGSRFFQLLLRRCTERAGATGPQHTAPRGQLRCGLLRDVLTAFFEALWSEKDAHNAQNLSWLKVPSTLFDDSAPSASLDCLKAQAAPTYPRAQPGDIGRLPWPQDRASGRPKVEDVPLSTTRYARKKLRLVVWADPPAQERAWLTLHTKKECADYALAPLVTPRRADAQLEEEDQLPMAAFVHHPQHVLVQRRETARLLAAELPRVDRVSLEEEISQLGDTYLYEYQELVAHDVAFYDIYMT